MEIVLDAKRFKGRTRAHAYLKEALRLPDGEETVIVVPEVIQKKEYLGDYGKTMLRVFKDAAEENEALTVIVKEAQKK